MTPAISHSLRHAAVALACAAGLALGNAAQAQSVADASGQAIPAADLKEVLRLAGSAVTASSSARVRNLYKASGSGYCGQINAGGSSTNWYPFHANIFTNLIFVLTPNLNKDDDEDVRLRLSIYGCLKRR